MDSLGIAAFSHDFESLHGKSSAIIENFDAFAKYPMRGFDIVVFLLTPFFPILLQLPGKRQEVNRKYRETVLNVADELLQKTRADKMSGDLKHDTSKSIIGALGTICFVSHAHVIMCCSSSRKHGRSSYVIGERSSGSGNCFISVKAALSWIFIDGSFDYGWLRIDFQ